MKKTLLVVSIVVAFVFTMGFAFAQEAPKVEAPAAAPAAEVKAPAAPAAEVKAAVTEEVVVGKLVVAAEKVTIAVEGKEAVAVKKDAKVAEIEKIEKFADKTFEFKGTFETVKEGDKEVKLFVIAAFAEKAAEAPKAPEAPKAEEKK